MPMKKLTDNDFVQSFVDSYGKNLSGMRLQERDYQLLKFVLEQKFISLEMIYLRFFCRKKSLKMPAAKELFTARQRLAKLKENGLVKTEKVLSSGKAHYLITPLGAKVLEAKSGEAPTFKISKKIYLPLYEHDSKINMIRICLELRDKCRRWYPEKWIRSAPLPLTEEGFKFGPELFPDGIFINSKGETVALELELSRKGLAKIKQKLKLYTKLLEQGIIHKIWVVATKDSIIRIYREAIQAVYYAGLDSWRLDYKEREEGLKIARLRASSYRIDDYQSVIEEDKGKA